jgi:hypothetical protein
MRELGHALLRVYLALIGLQTLILWAFGMSAFEAFCHSAATVG